jgi:hypothetical protein
MQVSVIFDLDVPEERDLLEHVLDARKVRGVSREFVRHIVGTTSGQLAVKAAQNYQPNDEFTLEDLATLIGVEKATVDSWMRQLGRPEKRFGQRIFQGRWDSAAGRNRYHLLPEVHAAINQEAMDRPI